MEGEGGREGKRLLMGCSMSNIRILAETMGSRKERYEMVLDGGGAEMGEEEETVLALGTRLANKEIRASAIPLVHSEAHISL